MFLSDFLGLLSSFIEKIGLDFKAIIAVYRHWYYRKREELRTDVSPPSQ
jgi:hypothetical protein